ncbi:hypothetical protein [Metabacillus endolithicus]|uniref:Uncharacterized protein n=1 Tax=Metabacillus endolithicus TaxID=1535204 RepID=A0ABW5C0H5_9BACI|nr:hypothetical protein [Metabacillus endolithicus]UPG61661.1 hypothetical protein MVE64_13185 [Metabacillus endolithicus]
MIDGFQKVINKLIEERLEQIITSEEYVMYSELLHKDLNEKLAQFEKFEDETKKDEFIDDIRANIFEQVHIQTKLVYRTAFNDAFVFAINTLVNPQKMF